MPNSWFRLYHEFSTNTKVQRLSEANQRRYIFTLAARCRLGDKPYIDSDAAFEMRIGDEDWMASKAILIKANLIDDFNKPTGWDERQYVSDSSTARVAKHREKKKRQQEFVTGTPPDTDTDTDTDTDRTLCKKKQKNKHEKSSNSVPYKKIIELYHRLLPDLPAVMKLTQKRKSQIRQRFKEDMGDLESWENFFIFVMQSDFLMGRIDPPSGRALFRADIEWLTNATNFTKIAEGKYHI